MKHSATLICLSATLLGVPPSNAADGDFVGVIESRPQVQVGTWVIGGHRVEVPAQATLDVDDGPLVVGACASVDYEDGAVEEIETERASRCAPPGPR